MLTLKPTFRLLCICCIYGFLSVGCTDTVETRNLDFSLSRRSVAFAVGGGTIAVEVATSDSWNASADADWISLDKAGSTLYITAQPNDRTSEIREAKVDVTANAYGTETIDVRQEPGEAVSLSVNCGTGEYVIDSEGGRFTFSVESNYDWSASLDPAVEGWMTVSDAASGTVTVTAGRNAGSSAVAGTVVVVAGEGGLTASEKVDIRQIPRSENPYFQFTGLWTVKAADCCIPTDGGMSWYGAEDEYGSCSIEEYDYTAGRLSLADWAFSGFRLDQLDFKAQTRTATVPLGNLCGTMTYGNTKTDLYLVAWDRGLEYYLAVNNSFKLVLSEDGGSISVLGLPEEYPVIGLVGSDGSRVEGIPCFMSPVTLTKSE